MECILGVERILGVCLTMVNVTADLTAVYMAKSEPTTRGATPRAATPRRTSVRFL